MARRNDALCDGTKRWWPSGALATHRQHGGGRVPDGLSTGVKGISGGAELAAGLCARPRRLHEPTHDHVRGAGHLSTQPDTERSAMVVDQVVAAIKSEAEDATGGTMTSC